MKRVIVKLQKRNNIYYLRYFFNGKDVKESTSTSDPDKASRIMEEREGQLISEELLY